MFIGCPAYARNGNETYSRRLSIAYEDASAEIAGAMMAGKARSIGL